MTMRTWYTRGVVAGLAAACALSLPVVAQRGTVGGNWNYYGGDAGSTKYSPLDQINAENVKNLQIAWRWKSDNFGPRPDPCLVEKPRLGQRPDVATVVLVVLAVVGAVSLLKRRADDDTTDR